MESHGILYASPRCNGVASSRDARVTLDAHHGKHDNINPPKTKIIGSIQSTTTSNSAQSIIIPTLILSTLLFAILTFCIKPLHSSPQTWTKVLLITFFATADLLQAGALLAALILQFSFLPPLLTRCKNYQGPAAIKHMFLHEATAKWMKKKEKDRKGGPNVYEVCKDYAETAYTAVFIM